MRVLPPRLRQTLYYRYYHYRHPEWARLFWSAPLSFSPNVSMFALVLGDIISGNIAFNGFYELELSREIARLARKGGLFVDVGANMGYFSLLWAGISPLGQVIAYEAAPRNIEILQNNIARNSLCQKISLVCKAAGAHDGQVAFELGPHDQTGWGGISRVSTATTIGIPLVRLDGELSGKTVEVLKIDAEGSDTTVLLGCEGLLKNKKVRRIYFEQNEVRMQELGIRQNEAQSFLRDLGYVCVPFLGSKAEWVAYPRAGT